MFGHNSDASPEIRKLWKSDTPQIAQHLLRLDPATRHSRFGNLVSDRVIKDYAENIIAGDKLVFGVFFDDQLRAIGELLGLFRSWPHEAEFALSVEPDWQDQGIGSTLFSRLLMAAQNRGIKSLHGFFTSENQHMLRIAAKHHPETSRNDGQIAAKFDAPWASPMSISREIAQDTSVYFRQVFPLTT